MITPVMEEIVLSAAMPLDSATNAAVAATTVVITTLTGSGSWANAEASCTAPSATVIRRGANASRSWAFHISFA